MTLTTSAETEVNRFCELIETRKNLLQKLRVAERAVQDTKNELRKLRLDYSPQEHVTGIAIASSWVLRHFAGMDEEAKRQEVIKIGRLFNPTTESEAKERDRLGEEIFGEHVSLFLECDEHWRQSVVSKLSEQYLPKALATFGFEDIVSQWRVYKNWMLVCEYDKQKAQGIRDDIENSVDASDYDACLRAF